MGGVETEPGNGAIADAAGRADFSDRVVPRLSWNAARSFFPALRAKRCVFRAEEIWPFPAHDRLDERFNSLPGISFVRVSYSGRGLRWDRNRPVLPRQSAIHACQLLIGVGFRCFG